MILGTDGKPMSQDELAAPPEDRRAGLESAMEAIDPTMAGMRATARRAEIDRRIADETAGTLLADLEASHGGRRGLARWLVELRSDILDNLHLFRRDDEGAGTPGPARTDGAERREPGEIDRRYAVNPIVDNGDTRRPNVVLEPNPTYENVFGAIERRPASGALHTDFTMIRGGAPHRANGGVLVPRADAIAAQPATWRFLKGALRDREIGIEELHRHGGAPLTGTPRPKPIPLDVKVVLVGAPVWRRRMLAADPEFRAHFKVKAEIDPRAPAEDGDVALFARLIQKQAVAQGRRCEDDAIDLPMGHAARWADDRGKPSSRFELIAEAGWLSGGDRIDAACVARAIDERRRRNGRSEARSQERVLEGAVTIDTDGAKTGRVNGLVHLDLGDRGFGLPSRIAARTYAGAYGVVNIERRVAMGGPIRQKCAPTVEGHLNGPFARRLPLSFSCSIAFEQSYGAVEGDSASLTETCAILSSLSGLPARQDIAMTGSLNQAGETRAGGGANHKVEGFFRACRERGLTGRQGVIVPAGNERNLVLGDEVVEAVREGRFHVWSVATAAEAIELLTGTPAGEAGDDDAWPPDSVFGRVEAQLGAFDRALTERAVDRLGGRRG